MKLKSEKFSLLPKINFETIINFNMRSQTKIKKNRIDFLAPKIKLRCPNDHPNMLNVFVLHVWHNLKYRIYLHVKIIIVKQTESLHHPSTIVSKSSLLGVAVSQQNKEPKHLIHPPNYPLAHRIPLVI